MNPYNIYCIAFDNSERKKSMQHRFTSASVEATFFEPIDKTGDIVAKYIENLPNKITHICGGASLTASSIAILKDFLNSDKSYGIICEDDIHIRKSFNTDIIEIINFVDKLDKCPDVILLGYLLSFTPNWNSRSINNTFTYQTDYPHDVWGTQMYMFSKAGATRMLELYDKPYDELCKNFGSYGADWLFTKTPTRALIYPMLAVEDNSKEYEHYGQNVFHKSCHAYNFNDSYV